MAVQLQDLRAAAQDLADLGNDNFVTSSPAASATWTRWANQGIEKLYKFLLPIFPDLFAATFDFTLAGSATSVALPAALRQLRGVSRDPDSVSARVALRKWNFSEREDVSRGVTGVAGTYRMFYVQGPLQLASDTDPIDPALEQYREFIETCMAIKACIKDRTDTAELRADLKDLKDEIEGEAGNRDGAEGDTIADIENPLTTRVLLPSGYVPSYRILGSNLVLR